jgi:hypothetical protein
MSAAAAAAGVFVKLAREPASLHIVFLMHFASYVHEPSITNNSYSKENKAPFLF